MVVALVALMAGVVALASQAGGATPAAVIPPSATPTPISHPTNDEVAVASTVPQDSVAPGVSGLSDVPTQTATPTPTRPSATPTPQRPSLSTPTPLPAPATATPIPTEENLATSTPTPTPYAIDAIEIPAIGVYAEVVPVGRAPDGTMATPENPYAVGWYAAGPRPGSSQNVLLAGHLDFVDQAGRARPGIFWRLRDLRPGDLVYLVQDSQRYRYVVQESIKVRYDDSQALDLLAPRRGALVTMITCEGPEFDPVARNYLWRRIVVAALWPI